MSDGDNESTGATRHRVNWRGQLILEVEYTHRPYCHEGGGSYGPPVTWWRDAVLADVMPVRGGKP